MALMEHRNVQRQKNQQTKKSRLHFVLFSAQRDSGHRQRTLHPTSGWWITQLQATMVKHTHTHTHAHAHTCTHRKGSPSHRVQLSHRDSSTSTAQSENRLWSYVMLTQFPGCAWAGIHFDYNHRWVREFKKKLVGGLRWFFWRPSFFCQVHYKAATGRVKAGQAWRGLCHC